MNQINEAIRANRFRIKSTEKVDLEILGKDQKPYLFSVENVSLTGACIRWSEGSEDLAALGFKKDEIFSSVRLLWGDESVDLGRVVLKRTEEVPFLGLHLGLSLIDRKIPIDGSLSDQIVTKDLQERSPYEYELSAEKFSLATFAESQDQNSDLFGKCRQYSLFHKEWEKSPKFLYNTVRTPSKGSNVNLTRKRKDGKKDYIIMGSNDYLGLASHPQVVSAAKKALDDYGFGSTGSPLTTGKSAIHEELTEYIADMFNKEKVVLFNSGYAANIGTLQGLTGEKDLILSDMLSHASIRDGMDLSRARGRFFKHNSVRHAKKILKEQRKNHRGSLLITEGVFSMDGDVAPIKEFVDLAKAYNCRTFVDEAHSFGVVGPNGMGACAKYEVTKDVDIIMGTFSKIAGSIGGFIATTKEAAEWINMFARAHMFSVSVPPSTAAASLKALQIFREDQSLIQNLQSNIQYFVDGLRAQGYPISKNHETAVVPVIIGNEAKMGVMNQHLIDNGVFVVPIVYPAVSRNSCRFRFTITATHTQKELDYVLATLAEASEKAGVCFGHSQKGNTQKEVKSLIPKLISITPNMSAPVRLLKE